MAKEAKMAEAVITKEMIEEMRSKIGLKLRTENSIHNEDCHQAGDIEIC